VEVGFIYIQRVYFNTQKEKKARKKWRKRKMGKIEYTYFGIMKSGQGSALRKLPGSVYRSA